MGAVRAGSAGVTEPFGDTIPWTWLRWRLIVTDGTLRVSLSDTEFFQAAAATELDRIHSLGELYDRQARYSCLPPAERWGILVDGCPGLRFRDAPGEMTVRQIFQRWGAENCEWVWGPTEKSNGGPKAD